MRTVAAVPETYRELPTTLIDADIVAGRPTSVEELEGASGGLKLGDKASTLIAAYRKERSPANIPRSVTIGFPLRYAYDGFQLVDSPGVNALGGLQRMTHAHLPDANAVLFVHSLQQQVESRSFLDFVSRTVPKRLKETLFLVLTHGAELDDIEAEQRVSAIKRQYDSFFPRHHVLQVDSLLKIVSDELRQHDTVASLMAHYGRMRQDYDAAQERSAMLTTLATEAGNKVKLLRGLDITDGDSKMAGARLRQLSNFDDLERTIDEFSSRAPELLLVELIKSVRSGYDAQVQNLEQNCVAWQLKRKNPQTFETDISKIQQVLEDLKLELNGLAERANREFPNKLHRERLETIVIDSKKAIESTPTIARGETLLGDFRDDIGSFVDGVGKDIGSHFEEGMRRVGEDFRAKHKITAPTVDVSGIVDKAKDSAYRSIEVPRAPAGVFEILLSFLTFGIYEPTKEVREYSDSRHVEKFKTEARQAVERAETEIYKLVKTHIDGVNREFRTACQDRITVRNEELDDIKRKRETNDDIGKNMSVAKRKMQDIKGGLTHLSEMERDLS